MAGYDEIVDPKSATTDWISQTWSLHDTSKAVKGITLACRIALVWASALPDASVNSCVWLAKEVSRYYGHQMMLLWVSASLNIMIVK